jgi:phosphoserine phosphatase RsbU/P
VLLGLSGEARAIQLESDPLGAFSTQVLQRKEIRTKPGERFFLYTDGLIEYAPGAGRHSGLERLMAACAGYRGPIVDAAAQIAAELRPDLRQVEDDLLLLAVEVRP